MSINIIKTIVLNIIKELTASAKAEQQGCQTHCFPVGLDNFKNCCCW